MVRLEAGRVVATGGLELLDDRDADAFADPGFAFGEASQA